MGWQARRTGEDGAPLSVCKDGEKIMVPKCKMEAAVGSGYRVVAGWSLELALLPPLRTEVGRLRGTAWRRLLRWGNTKPGQGPGGHASPPPRPPHGKFAKELERRRDRLPWPPER